MKNTTEKIDLLLQRNADEQLNNVDWNKLNSAISRRLDETQQGQISAIGPPTVFKIAAGLAAAAAIVLIMVMIKPEKPRDTQHGKDGTAMVKFVDNKGSASVEFKTKSPKSHAIVDFGGNITLAKCTVEIIDSKEIRKKDGTQATWIIVSRPEPVYAGNGANQDTMDMICLF